MTAQQRVLVLVAAAAAGSCFYQNKPVDGAQACAQAPAKQCPDGYHCAGDGHCWQNGHDPVAGDGGSPDGNHPDGGSDAGGSDTGTTDAGNPGCGPNMHSCSATCVADNSIDHCGGSCDACKPPTGATATCDGSNCGFECTGALKKCNGKCVSECCVDIDCPDKDGKKGQCDTSTNTCSYIDCTTGNKPCGTTCIPSATCCGANDCTGSCMTCSGPGGSCVQVKNADDTDSCAGTCDANGECRSKRGQTCTTTSAGCIAGTTCAPDGVCCNSACNAACQACDISGMQGTCTTLAPGSAPHGNRACLGAGTTCAGTCMGAANGACTYPTGNCGPGPSCASASESIAQSTCGNGTCNTPSSQPCLNGYACAGTACKTSCTANSDCQSNYFCRSGTCRLKATKVACGSQHTCVLLADGSIRCWGSNSVGQLGNGQTTGFTNPDVLTPVTVMGFGAGGKVATSISAGSNFSCAIAGGNVWCWGSNQYGELGSGAILNVAPYGSGTPSQVTGFSAGLTANVISCGQSTNCALMSNSGIWCWGYNSDGELGRGTFTPSPPSGIPSAGPVGVPSQITGFTQLALSPATSSSCGVFSGGTTSCWGFNGQGELGGGYTSFNPAGVAGLVGVSGLPSGTLTSLVAVGNSFSCAVQSDHTTWCWGQNSNGQLGIGSADFNMHLAPLRVSASALPTSPAITQLGSGFYHSCVLITGNTLKCWGDNGYGQLGNGGLATPNPTPAAVSGLPSGDPITQLAVGVTHTCVLLQSGAVWCWGRNDDGQLGNNSQAVSPTPVQVQAW